MAKNNWFVKTYKTLGINETQLYTLWFVFFVSVSILFGYYYFLLFPISKTLLVFSPLIFFLFVTATKRQQETSQNLIIIMLIGAGHVGLFLLAIAIRHGYEIISFVQPYDFYLLPLIFCCGWLLNAKSAYEKLKRSLGQEWWLDIKLENMVASRDDIQVGHQNIDDYLLIYGEPRTWWEKRLKESAALSVLNRLRSRGDSCSLTGTQIELCTDEMKPHVEQWHQVLHDNPPTPQDWKDSGFDFSIPAKDKATAASHSGIPIAIPSFTDENEKTEKT